MENQFSQYQDLEKIMITRDEIQTQVKDQRRLSGKNACGCVHSQGRGDVFCRFAA